MKSIIIQLGIVSALFLSSCGRKDLIKPDPHSGQPDSSNYIPIKVHLSITVGKVLYDSLPGELKIDAVDAAGRHWKQDVEMAAGINHIKVPGNYKDYRFSVSKWNILAEKKVTDMQLITGTTVHLTSTRAAKQLLSETSYTELQTGLKEESRNDYEYNSDNTLKEVKYWVEGSDKPGLQNTMTNRFNYAGGRLQSILRYSGDSGITGTTTFSYAGEELSNILQKSYDLETEVALIYKQTSDARVVSANHRYFNGNTLVYQMTFKSGNLVSDIAMSSRGGGESGTYAFDSYVNPYHQLGFPDIFLSRSSKNNKIREEKIYSGGFPVSLPFKWEYKYDADGYPTELWTSYKSYTSGAFLFRTKRVFRYW